MKVHLSHQVVDEIVRRNLIKAVHVDRKFQDAVGQVQRAVQEECMRTFSTLFQTFKQNWGLPMRVTLTAQQLSAISEATRTAVENEIRSQVEQFIQSAIEKETANLEEQVQQAVTKVFRELFSNKVAKAFADLQKM